MACEFAFLEMDQQYPFLQTRQNSSNGSIVQVRKVIQFDSQPRFTLKEKTRVLKSLGFQNLVGLESSKSDQDSLILYFQYVPFQFIGEINKLDEQKISKVYAGMLQLCNNLASRSIIHQLDVRRVGLDKTYAVKYYLGLDFKVDRSIDKQKTLENYRNLITQFFIQVLKNSKSMKQTKEDIKITEKRSSYNFLGLSPKNDSFNVTPSKSGLDFENFNRKILKKSSTLETDKEDELRAVKVPKRFTFNNDNPINLPIQQNENTQIQKEKCQPLKIEQLNARINRLKDYMKQVTSKTGSKNEHSSNKDSQATNQKSQKYRFLSPTFAKFQKRITELRQSKMALAKKAQQNICNKELEKTNNMQVQSQIQTFSTSEGLGKTTESNQLPSQPILKKSTPSGLEDDRQHKQYLMLANKDKYCQEFMLFLEDNQSCIQSLLNKKAENIDNSTVINQNIEQQLKKITLREHLKTQSSQNALQIQNRVQKVIRSSLRIINGLKSRQTIKCE